MSDQTVVVEINKTWRTVIAIATLLFHAAVIGILIWKGDPANTLHQSALTWSYVTGTLVLAGLGLGAVSEYLPSLVYKR